MTPPPNYPACSFCSKRQNEVEKLIAGPMVYICNACVDLCDEILDEERDRSGIPRHGDKRGPKIAGAPLPPPEPIERASERDLVANLRARCGTDAYSAVGHGGIAMTVVPLPRDLVLAIADGIEMAAQGPSLDDDFAPSETARIATQAAKDIVKLIVSRLFEPAKTEGEKALDACKRLGLSDEKVGDIIARPDSGLGPAAPWLLGGLVGGILPRLYWALRKRSYPFAGMQSTKKDGTLSDTTIAERGSR
jgi:hypothetical protein